MKDSIFDVFDNINENKGFIEDVNSDLKPLTTQTIITKGKSVLTIEPNTLSAKQRSRSKNGRTIVVHLFVEELELIEQTAEKLSEPVSNFARQVLLDKAKVTLGEDHYNRTLENKRNVKKKE